MEIVPNASPPVCKIINFGKFKYELAKKDKIQKKHQHVSLLKELRFHPNTDTHDFDFKARHARQFLTEGHKVKATVVFKGTGDHVQGEGGGAAGPASWSRLSEVSKVDQPAHMEGRSMIMILAPENARRRWRRRLRPRRQPRTETNTDRKVTNGRKQRMPKMKTRSGAKKRFRMTGSRERSSARPHTGATS